MRFTSFTALFALAAPALAALAVAAAGPVAAQDFAAEPLSGTIRLSPGFTPDPNLTSLMAGGTVDASSKFEDCQGYISNAPDVRLFWDATSKSGLNLKISALSNSDTTLVVNGPDGRWYCDDDSGEDGNNPLVELVAVAGRYEIWVGTYSQGDLKRAVLSISEVMSF